MSEPESRSTAFFEGFAWAIPTAFASPLSSYRFEEGDVLYRSPAAYEDPADACRGEAIQVLAPPRSARTSLAAGESGSRRQANWNSEVEWMAIDVAKGRSVSHTTTQGQLWTLLWKGAGDGLDLAVSEAADCPAPLEARELQAHLESSRSAFDKRNRKKRVGPGCRFLMVVDLASDASRAKADAAETALVALGRCDVLDLSAAELGVEEAGDFSPTLVIRQLLLRGGEVAAAESALRNVLYQGRSAQADTEDAREEGAAEDAADAGPEPVEKAEGAGGRFSISRHGWLEALP